ncbi:MAG: hypothetical protein IKM99_03865 [Bacteroidales bacterium]|nr:hypothetical protein [Bacteroidales bacterium]
MYSRNRKIKPFDFLPLPETYYFPFHYNLSKAIEDHTRQQQRIELLKAVKHERAPRLGLVHHRNGKAETADKKEKLPTVEGEQFISFSPGEGTSQWK